MTNTLQSQPRSFAAGDALRTAIADRQTFRTNGALRGEQVRYGGVSTGILPSGHVDMLSADGTNVDYVVYSYATPIAWHTADGAWRMPEVTYSPTTTRHQSQTRMAITDPRYTY